MKHIGIIGGGAAGLMAAYSAWITGGDDVLIHVFEKNKSIGKKLLITGKGRCNITNIGDTHDFMENIPHNGSFLFSAFNKFNNYDVINLCEAHGVPTKVERGGRVFPVSDKASDIVLLFEALLKRNNIHIHFENDIKEIVMEDKIVSGVVSSSGILYNLDKLIIATGGLSYPNTGSTGEGYNIAKAAGHSVTKLFPSLVPLTSNENLVLELAGLSLRNVGITLKDTASKTVYTDFGEMIFTHFGVSGPIIISASSHIVRKKQQSFTLLIDLKPALDEKTLDLRLLKDFEKYKNKDLKNALFDLLPQRIIPAVISKSILDDNKKIRDITKSERKLLCYTIKNFAVNISGAEGFSHAVITAGGVNVSEVNPKTMQSKIISGLYFAGEILDLDAYTGGYNLQIAFSTGYLAGHYAAYE